METGPFDASLVFSDCNNPNNFGTLFGTTAAATQKNIADRFHAKGKKLLLGAFGADRRPTTLVIFVKVYFIVNMEYKKRDTMLRLYVDRLPPMLKMLFMMELILTGKILMLIGIKEPKLYNG
jgi:hypothetical protein